MNGRLWYRGWMARIERIEVRSVTRLFGATAALRGVSVTFRGGEICMLEGPNGAGKSTLLAVVATVLRPTSGRVRYVPLGEGRAEARAQIGWLPHETHCYRELSGRQNVELAARMYGVDPGEAWRRVSGRVGLDAFGERSVGTLSRGQRQRVALARALVHAPSVLLLDEPTSGLDERSAEQLERVVLDERERGSVVVVVSHSRGLAERVSDARVRLEAGRIRKSE